MALRQSLHTFGSESRTRCSMPCNCASDRLRNEPCRPSRSAVTHNFLNVTCRFSKSRTPPIHCRNGFAVKKGSNRQEFVSTFSRRTRHPMFMGMTAGQRDILVSLSANLKWLFSRTFSTDARSLGLRRRQSFLHSWCRSFFPALEFRFDSYPSSTKVRYIQRFLAISSNEQTCSRHLRSISGRELFLLSTYHRTLLSALSFSPSSSISCGMSDTNTP